MIFSSDLVVELNYMKGNVERVIRRLNELYITIFTCQYVIQHVLGLLRAYKIGQRASNISV